MSSTNTQSAEAKREKRLQRRRERERAHRAPYRSKQKAPKEDTLSEIEPIISSIAQGPAIKEYDKDRLDVLLTDDSGKTLY